MRDYTLLKIYDDAYETIAKSGMRTNNSMRNWYRDTLPKEEWGEKDFSDKALADCNLPNDLRMFNEIIENAKKSTQKYLHKEVKKHFLYPYLENVRGIGGNLSAKLLSRLGDLNRFPTVSHLWSYCGLDGDGWKTRPHSWGLTSVCYLIADSFQHQKKGSEGYRTIYDERKVYESERPPCEKCLEKGNLEHCSPAHINNRARRYAVKMFLKDLWIENQKRQNQFSCETQKSPDLPQ